MLNAFKLQISTTPSKLQLKSHTNALAFRTASTLRLPNRRSDFASLAVQTESSELTSTVGFSPPAIHHQPLTQRHVHVLSFFACAAAISAAWLFCSAIPALLAFKRAAESLEKLMDVTREELPDTMAAVRLSGMEIGDLTMELSDLSQGITQGVRSSTRAVRMAEERLRQFTNTTPTVSVQVVDQIETGNPKLALARSARGMREGIIKGRSVVQMFFSLTRLSKMLFNHLKSRKKA